MKSLNLFFLLFLSFTSYANDFYDEAKLRNAFSWCKDWYVDQMIETLNDAFAKEHVAFIVEESASQIHRQRVISSLEVAGISAYELFKTVANGSIMSGHGRREYYSYVVSPTNVTNYYKMKEKTLSEDFDYYKNGEFIEIVKER